MSSRVWLEQRRKRTLIRIRVLWTAVEASMETDAKGHEVRGSVIWSCGRVIEVRGFEVCGFVRKEDCRVTDYGCEGGGWNCDGDKLGFWVRGSVVWSYELPPTFSAIYSNLMGFLRARMVYK